MDLRTIRVVKGYSQNQVSKALGYTSTTGYAKIEHGKQQLRVDQLAILADFYDVSVDFLLSKVIPKRNKNEVDVNARD